MKKLQSDLSFPNVVDYNGNYRIFKQSITHIFINPNKSERLKETRLEEYCPILPKKATSVLRETFMIEQKTSKDFL